MQNMFPKYPSCAEGYPLIEANFIFKTFDRLCTIYFCSVFWSKKIWRSAWNWIGRVAHIKYEGKRFGWMFIIIPRRHMFIGIECSFDAVDFRFVCCVFSVFPVHHDSQECMHVCVCGFMEPSCDFTFMQCGHHEHWACTEVSDWSRPFFHIPNLTCTQANPTAPIYRCPTSTVYYDLWWTIAKKAQIFSRSSGSSFCDASFRVCTI